MFDFQYQIKNLPQKPGVYLMKNSLGEIIYVGKAKNLKNRVKQYFQSQGSHAEKVKKMVENISEFEYIVTDSEMEALILECNLIKKFRPRYNILLMDDKHYPFIKLTVNEEYPRVIVVRNILRDGAKYFGPYPDVSAVYETLDLIKKVFPLRSCKKKAARPCLNYHMGLCKAPCQGLISKEEYDFIIKEVVDLLSGKNKILINKLQKTMEEASDILDFEKAADCRDKIAAIEKITKSQNIFTGNLENEDYIDFYCDEKDTAAQVLFLREGKLMGSEHFILQDTYKTPREDIAAAFIKEFYGGTAFVPKKVLVENTADKELLQQWLSIKKGSKVEIISPQRGEKKQRLNMAKNNAEMTLNQFKLKILKEKQANEGALINLSNILALDELPQRIEAYDISNIQGVDSVGSMIVFEKGKAKPNDYRRFKINTVKGANDYDSMREILTRRFLRGISEIEAIKGNDMEHLKGKFCVFPDLILMDGGKGQVNVALQVLSSLNINIPVCGMVKDERHNSRGLIYNNKEIYIEKNSAEMQLITRIQDEAHRFAITYHRSLRDKRTLHSVLDEIPDVGSKRRRELLMKFKSIDNIKKASLEELLETPSINSKAAESIINYFNLKEDN